MAAEALAEDKTSAVGRRVHAEGGAQGGHTQTARWGTDLGHPDGAGSPDSTGAASSDATGVLNLSSPSRATAFDLDATRIKPCQRHEATWRITSVGLWTWTWKSSSTASTTMSSCRE